MRLTLLLPSFLLAAESLAELAAADVDADFKRSFRCRCFFIAGFFLSL
jgi:hypothetical protein